MAARFTRLLGEHFRDDGTPKTRFESEREALDCIERYDYRDKVAYHCDFCGGWHLATHRRVA
jgi:hypothetical protein